MPLTVPKGKEKEYLKNIKIATRGTGRMMMFAGDQKVEHLNDDFVGRGIPSEVADPQHYFKIASVAQIGVFATQMGLIAQYGRDYPDIPYLVKVNSKTNLIKKEYKDPVSTSWMELADILSFKQQSGLQIIGVGFTIYLGSWYEPQMFSEAAKLIHSAHQEGLLAVVWMYPRGQAVKNEADVHLLAGAAGVGVCLGADFVKINYPYAGNNLRMAKAFKEVVNAAGRTGIICVGGSKKNPKKFLQSIHDQVNISGTRGNAVGRNIYQHTVEEGVRMANAISAVTLYGYSASDAYEIFLGKQKLIVKK